MPPTIVANCNRDFVRATIAENVRLDSRKRDEYRLLNIMFGLDYGCCLVNLGGTKVLAQVSSEITEPSDMRPAEGKLKVNLEMSPMAHPNFDGRLHDLGIEVIRLLERTIRDSRCIDLEPLCLIEGSKVWSIRVDVTVINYEGNLIEAVSVASIAALAHFRRPDVTISAGELKIYSMDMKEPIPMSVLHYPVCTKICFFNKSKYFAVDPLELEEQVCDGYVVIGSNSYNEITTIHVSGKAEVEKEKILTCCSMGVRRSQQLTEMIKEALQEDGLKRKSGKISELGFAPLVKTKDPALCSSKIHLAEVKVDDIEDDEEIVAEEIEYDTNFQIGKRRRDRVLGEGGPSQWDNLKESQFEVADEEDEEGELISSSESDAQSPEKAKIISQKNVDEIQIDDDEDSEEEVVVLNPDQLK